MPLLPSRRALVSLTIWTLGCVSAFTCAAQTPNTSNLDAYRAAVTQQRLSDRLPALARFVASGPSSLRTDALQLLTWYEFQAGDRAQASQWARQLLQLQPANPIAATVLAEDINPLDQETKPSDASVDLVRQALSHMQELRSPEGMPGDDYELMRNYVYGTLTASAGCSYLREKQYVAAQQYLHAALAYLPGDTRLSYCLALADLTSPKPNAPEGYWYLARTVNLSQGTVAGRQIAIYARQRYKKDGGSAADWDRFLAAAATTDAAQQVQVASASTPASSAAPPAKPSASNVALKPSGTQTVAPSVETAKVERLPRPASEPPASLTIRPAPSPVPGGPVSLGVLVESDLSSKETRGAVVSGLDDLLRNLGREDEAFIMSFSDDLLFQQDLTENVRSLEDALTQIKPHHGHALYDAVSFASGHLARVAKNKAQVLLVISDGRNSGNHISPFQLSGELSARGVRIYCIGVNVGNPEDRQRLEVLARRTGGDASFVSSGQFTTATQQLVRLIRPGPGS